MNYFSGQNLQQRGWFSSFQLVFDRISLKNHEVVQQVHHSNNNWSIKEVTKTPPPALETFTRSCFWMRASITARSIPTQLRPPDSCHWFLMSCNPDTFFMKLWIFNIWPSELNLITFMFICVCFKPQPSFFSHWIRPEHQWNIKTFWLCVEVLIFIAYIYLKKKKNITPSSFKHFLK